MLKNIITHNLMEQRKYSENNQDTTGHIKKFMKKVAKIFEITLKIIGKLK